MLYMVQIEVQPLPGDWPQERIDDIRRREVDRVLELMRAGVLVSALFRVPGRNANFGVWKAETPEALDQALRSLPLHPFMRLEVTPLMAHPSEAAYKKKFGEMNALRGVSDA